MVLVKKKKKIPKNKQTKKLYISLQSNIHEIIVYPKISLKFKIYYTLWGWLDTIVVFTNLSIWKCWGYYIKLMFKFNLE